MKLEPKARIVYVQEKKWLTVIIGNNEEDYRFDTIRYK